MHSIRFDQKSSGEHTVRLKGSVKKAEGLLCTIHSMCNVVEVYCFTWRSTSLLYLIMLRHCLPFILCFTEICK